MLVNMSAQRFALVNRSYMADTFSLIGQACGTEPDYFVEYSGLEREVR